MTEEDIKRCPWCGNKPVFHRSYSKIRLSHECDVIRIVMPWGIKKDLLEKWNHQTSEIIPKRKITCSGAGQCDHDGVGCSKESNCGEYEEKGIHPDE